MSNFEIRDLKKYIIWKTQADANLLLHSHNCFLHFWCHAQAKLGVLVFGVHKHTGLPVNVSPASAIHKFSSSKKEGLKCVQLWLNFREVHFSIDANKFQ